jgi:steroid delta-isomerase-like uncharacterized protein
MSADENKALNRRLVEEGFSKGDMAVLDELIAVDCIDHAGAPAFPSGVEGVKQFFTMFRGAFPDLGYTIEDMIAEGDMVVTRNHWQGMHQGPFLGIPPTGKQVTVSGIDVTRWAGGKAVEHWANQDTLGLLQQLGVVPEPEPVR